MADRLTSTALILSAWLITATAVAQTTRTEEIAQQKAEKADAVQPPTRETGDVLIGKLESLFKPAPPAVQVSFGGFRPGAGLGPGIGYSTPIGERALWSGGTAWSTRDFKLAESALELPQLVNDRVNVRAFARWEDAPRLDFFGLGPATSTTEASYGLRSSSARADAAFHVTPAVIVGARSEYLRMASDGRFGAAT